MATADLKALRYPADSPVIPDPTSGSYLALYWVLAGGFGQWMQWGSQQVQWLHDHDRMFAERDHVHTLMYKFRTEFEEPDGVPVELALDHRSPYVVVLIGSRPRARRSTTSTPGSAPIRSPASSVPSSPPSRCPPTPPPA